MKLFTFSSLILAMGALIFGLSASDSHAQDEFRALWVTRFEWPDRNPDTCRGKIVSIMEQCEKANFNAVIFQCRGQADVLYPSPIEPWAPSFGSADPGWDPLQFAIEEAHKRGLELHAYINPIPAWTLDTPPPATEPAHKYALHGPGTADCWAILDAQGKANKHEYYWFSPGVPSVHEHARKVVIDLATRYDLDGIHLDRIRYPSADDFNPTATTRFNGSGNPLILDRFNWQLGELNRMVTNLSSAAWAIKPKMKMSAAVWGIYDKTKIPGYGGFSTGLQQYCQDSLAWARLGLVDALCPMIYWDLPDPKPNYDECLKQFLEGSGSRHVYGGMHAKFEPAELKAQVEVTRKLGGKGTVIFSTTSMSKDPRWQYYGTDIYPTKVKTPEMPWKTNPTEGFIVGYVKRSTEQPVVDAYVTVEGQDGGILSCADGYFSFLWLKPGKYTLIARIGGRVAKVSDVEVKAGQFTTANLTM